LVLPDEAFAALKRKVAMAAAAGGATSGQRGAMFSAYRRSLAF
jgi:hypothetical protein